MFSSVNTSIIIIIASNPSIYSDNVIEDNYHGYYLIMISSILVSVSLIMIKKTASGRLHDRLMLITPSSVRSSWLDIQDHGLEGWDYECEIVARFIVRRFKITQ